MSQYDYLCTKAHGKKNKHMGGAFTGLPEPVRDWLPIDPVRRVYVEGRWSGSQQLEITQNRGNLL